MLVQVLRDDCGSGPKHLNLVSHGREDLFADVDLSRTVGWFTSLYPALFQIPAGGSPGERNRAVKEQCREIPRPAGIRITALAVERCDTRQKGRRNKAARNLLQLLGNLDNSLSAYTWFALATESSAQW